MCDVERRYNDRDDSRDDEDSVRTVIAFCTLALLATRHMDDTQYFSSFSLSGSSILNYAFV